MAVAERPTLKSLIDEFHAEVGFMRMIKMQQIRNYMNQTPLDKLKHEVDLIDNRADINVIIGAGPRGAFYYYCMQRGLTIMGG